MDDRHFDALTRTIGRRGMLGTVFGLASFAWRNVDDTAAGPIACTKKDPGSPCRRGADCCSGRCQRKKGKRKGRCLCSALLKPCFENFDCCARISGANDDVVCSDKDGFDAIVCCVAFGGRCQDAADCCSEFVCESEVCSSP